MKTFRVPSSPNDNVKTHHNHIHEDKVKEYHRTETSEGMSVETGSCSSGVLMSVISLGTGSVIDKNSEGDDGKNNLIPAKELGMKTILFQDINQLKDNLKNMGIDL